MSLSLVDGKLRDHAQSQQGFAGALVYKEAEHGVSARLQVNLEPP